MTVIGILWVVLTPYGTGLVVAWSRHVNRLVTRYLRASTTVGWSALATLLAGVFAVGEQAGTLMAMASAPLVGLAMWGPRRGPDDDDREPEPDDDPPAPRSGERIPSPPRARPGSPARVRTYVRGARRAGHPSR